MSQSKYNKKIFSQINEQLDNSFKNDFIQKELLSYKSKYYKTQEQLKDAEVQIQIMKKQLEKFDYYKINNIEIETLRQENQTLKNKIHFELDKNSEILLKYKAFCLKFQKTEMELDNAKKIIEKQKQEIQQKEFQINELEQDIEILIKDEEDQEQYDSN